MKMEKKILLVLIFIGILELGCIIFYDYSFISEKYIQSRWIIYICILSLDVMFVFVHLLLYPPTRYLIFILLSLILFLLGDIFIQIYDQPFENFIDNPASYAILAGSCYFLARILLTIIFALRDGTEIIEIARKVVCFSHFLFTVPYLAFGITFLCLRPSYITGFIFIYLSLSFSFLQSYALMRFIKEKGISPLISVSLLNFSHVMIISLMYNKSIPQLLKLLATNTYWVSMFLLTTSILSSNIESDFDRF
jgi:hypothetical protein